MDSADDSLSRALHPHPSGDPQGSLRLREHAGDGRANASGLPFL